jgi:hypothetical protein
MNATMLLGDYARASDGKLDILGAGWTFTGPAPTTFGVGIIFSVPWDEANVKHRFTLDLLDADGRHVEAPSGAEPMLHVEGDLEVGRPPGIRPGSAQTAAFAVNAATLPLAPGQVFQLRLVMDGDEDAAVSVAFSTRDSPPAQA